jgi:CRISPR-associated protein Cas2
MLIVAYDISNNKLRSQFSRFLEKHGYRLQYSIFQIKNSKRILNIIITEIEERFKKQFKNCDSIIIFQLSNTTTDTMLTFGYTSNKDDDIVFM